MSSVGEGGASAPITTWHALTKPRGLAWTFGALALLHAAVFLPGLLTLWQKWTRPDGYYGHGPLALGVVVWLVWRDRHAIAPLLRQPAPTGLVAIALSLWLLLGARGARAPVIEHYALWLSLMGSIAVVSGWLVIRRTWFAWTFTLLAVIPLPSLFIVRISGQLKLWATHAATDVLYLFGTAAVRQGGTIHLADGQLLYVDDVCSGLRSVVALLAMAAVFAYLQPVRWRAVATLLLALPLAIVANAMRILFLCLCVLQGANAALREPWHGLSGLIAFLVALGILASLQAPLARAQQVSTPDSVAYDAATRSCQWPTRMALAMLCAGGILLQPPTQAKSGAPASSGPSMTASIPLTVGAWTGIDVSSPHDLPGVFKTDDYVFREYRHPNEPHVVELFVLYGETPDQGLHGPQFCYLLQGFTELEVGRTHLLIAGRDLEVGRALIEHDLTKQRALIYFYYRFDQDQRAFSTDYESRLRPRQLLSAMGVTTNSQSACTVRISTAVPADPRSGEAALRRFAAEVLGKVSLTGAWAERGVKASPLQPEGAG